MHTATFPPGQKHGSRLDAWWWWGGVLAAEGPGCSMPLPGTGDDGTDGASSAADVGRT